MIRRAIRWVRIISEGAGLFIAALLLTLHLPPVQQRIAELAVLSTVESSGASLKVEDLSFNLFTGHLHAARVQIGTGPDRPAVLDALNASASLKLRYALSGRLVVESVNVDRLRLTFLRDAAGKWNLPRSSSSSGPVDLSYLPIAATVNRLSVVYADEPSRYRLEVPDGRLQLGPGEGPGRNSAVLTGTRPWNMRVGDTERSFTLSALRLHTAPDSLELDRVQFGSPRLSGYLQGRLTSISNLHGVVDIHAEGRLEDLFPVKAIPVGGVVADARLEAQGADWKISGRTVSDALAWRGLSPAAVSALLSYDSTKGVLDVREGSIQSPDGHLRLSGSLALGAPARRTRIEANGALADVARVLSRFGVDAPVSSSLSGRTAVEFAGLDWAGAAGEAEVRLEMRPAAPHRVPTALDATLSITPQQATAEIRSVAVPGVAASGNLTLGRGDKELRGQLDAESADLVELLNSLGVPRNGTLTGGNARCSIKVAGSREQPRLEGSLEAHGISVGPVGGISLRTSLALEDRVMNVAGGELQWQGSRASFRGSVDFRSESPEITIESAGRFLDLHALGKEAGFAIPVGGRAELDLSAQGSFRAPHARIRLRGTDVSVAGQDLGQIDGAMVLEGSTLRVDSLLASAPQARGTATLNLDTKRYSVSFNMPQWSFTPVEAAPGMPLRGSASLSLRGEGSLDDPKLDAELETKGLALGDFPLGGIIAKAKLSGGTVHVDAWASDLALRAQASAKVSPPYAAEVTAITEGTDFSRLRLPVTGRLKGKMEAHGDLAAPLEGSAKATIDEFSLEIGGERLESRGPMAIEVASGRLNLSPASLAIGAATLHLDGSLPLSGGSQQGSVRVEGEFPNEFFQGLLTQSKIEMKGNVKLVGAATGSVQKPAFSGTLHTGDLRIANPSAKLSVLVRGEANVSTDSPELAALQVSARLAQADLSIRDLIFQQDGDSRLHMERGELFIDHLAMNGPNTSLLASGSVGLVGSDKLDVRLEGKLDASLLSAAQSGFVLSGPAQIHAALSGTRTQPSYAGSFALLEGRGAITSPVIEADHIKMRVDLMGKSLELAQFEGEVNGGKVQGTGRATTAGGKLELDLGLKAEGVYLEYPAGLKTVSNSSFTLRNEGDHFLLQGKLELADGAYREGLTMSSLMPGGSTGARPAESILDQVRADIAITTLFPLTVDNNIGRVEAEANVRVVGPLRDPGLTGRMLLAPGGRVYAMQREFRLERANIDFINERRIEASLDVEATTRAGQYDITLRSSGALDNLQTTLTSRPQLTQTQIESVLATGSPDNAAATQSGMLGMNAVSLFGSSMVGGVNTKLQRMFGVSELRIEPGLISSESNPTARFTVGQNLTENLRFVYSSSLTENSSQIWFGEYDWRRKILGRFTRQDDDTYRTEVRQKFEFGGGPGTGQMRGSQQPARNKVGKVELQGTLIFPEEIVRKKLDLKSGAKYDFVKLQSRLDKLTRFYADKGYLEARVRMQRQRGIANSVDLTFEITPGPAVETSWEGFDYSRGTRRKAALAWQQGIIDLQRSNQAMDVLKREIYSSGYADAHLTAEVSSDGHGKRVKFKTTPGPKLGKPTLILEGMSVAEAPALRSAIEARQLDRDVQTKPEALRAFIETYLQGQGYLGASASTPELRREAGRRPVTVVAVRPGAPFKVGAVRLEGVMVLSEKTLRDALPLRTGDKYTPENGGSWKRSLERCYWKDGYRDVTIRMRPEPKLEEKTVDVVFAVDEGKRGVVAGIAVDGNVRTSEAFVLDRVPLQAGQAADTEKLNQARKNLVESLAYNVVEVKADPATPEQTPPGLPADAQPLWLSVKLREPKPYRLDVGTYYDTGRGTGFVTDVSRGNLFGAARTLGTRLMLDGQRQEARLYYDQPYLFRHRIQTTGAVGVSNENSTNLVRTQSLELSLQQTIRMSQNRWTFNYGYRYRWNNFFLRAEGGNTAVGTSSSAPLFATVSRDTRPDFLDAWKGSFVSNALEWGPSVLGGSYPYKKYYGQFFKYFNLTRAVLTPFSSAPRSRVVFASGARIGFIWSPSQSIFLPTVAFLAGGGTTVRGYPYNSLGTGGGDTEIAGWYIGGRSTLILNNELRFPLWKFLDLATFVDNGNTWRKPSEFSVTDLRSSMGLGIRVRNPFIVLRFDYGRILGRKPGEPAGGFYFSIGQIF